MWFLAAVSLYLLGNGQNSLWDRDEPRFAGAARAMVATGNWIVPHFNQSNRYDKPILIYWFMGAAMRWLGANEFAARLVSSFAGAGVVALVCWLALRMGCGAAGTSVAAGVVMLSPQVFWLSKAATADALLLLTIVGAMALYWEQRRSRFAWWRHLGFWALLGASVLTKGPPGPAIVGSAVIFDHLWQEIARRRASAHDHSSAGAAMMEDHASGRKNPPAAAVWASPPWRLLLIRGGVGLVVFFAVVTPWVWVAWRQTHGEFFRVGIGYHVIERSLSPLDEHGGPLWYYLPVLLVATFPATALVLTALRWAFLHASLPATRLLWCWLVPGVFMFSLARTKLPHYIAPVIPAMALMSGLWWSGTRGGTAEQNGSGTEAWRRASACVGALMGVALGAGLAIIPRAARLPALQAPLALAGASLAVSAVLGGVWWWRRRAARAVIAWSAGTVAAMVFLLLWAMPALEPLRPSPILAHWLKRNAPLGTRLAAGYQEPSLVFYWGHPVQELGPDDGAIGLRLLRDPSTPTALVADANEWRDWLAASRSILPRRVSVRYARRFYVLERGRWTRLLIIGNW